jgi:protease I
LHPGAVSSNSSIDSYNYPMEDVQVLVIITNQFNMPEYLGAINQLESYGCNITIAGPFATIGSGSDEIIVDLLISEVVASDFDCMYIPGGVSAEDLCLIPEVLTLLQDANALGICLAAICAGPLVFAAADIISGRNVTGNILIKSTLQAAGGIFFDSGQCVRDDNLVTADGPYLLDLVIEIVKVLGFYENNPPSIGPMYYELNYTSSSIECYLEVQVTDVFGVKSVQAVTYRIEDNGAIRSLVSSIYLTDPDKDSIFSNTITEMTIGDYIIELTVFDILFNGFTNESFLEFTIEQTNQSGIRFGIIGIYTTIVIGVLVIRHRNKQQKKQRHN